MNFFRKEKQFRVYAIYKMIEHINSYKELFFQNTPLQNLKNILSDADASMESRAGNTFENNSLEQSILFEKKGISKSALQEVLNQLLVNTPGQYISPAAASRIVCQLCAEEKSENISKIGDFSNNISIIKLRNITKMI